MIFSFRLPARLRRGASASFFVGCVLSGAITARAQSQKPVSTPVPASIGFLAPSPSLIGAPVPVPNGFDFLFDAVEKMVPPDRLGASQQIPAPEILRVKRANVARNKLAFAALRLALATAVLHPPVRDAGGDFGAYAKFRTLAELLDEESAVRASNRDFSGALQSKLDCIEFGVVITRGAPLRASLAGRDIENIGRKDLETIVSHLSGAECVLAAQRLERIESLRPPFADSLREGKVASIAVTRDILSRGSWEEVIANFRKLDGRRFTDDELATLGTVGETEIVAGLDRTFNAALQSANAPYRLSAPRQDAALDPWTMAFAGAVNSPSYRIDYEAARASNRLLSLALRLRAERMAHGAYPETFATAPDPFAGAASPNAPLQYRRAGSSFSLYSVGPNAKDDGGIPAPLTKSGQIAPDASGDILAPTFPL